MNALYIPGSNIQTASFASLLSAQFNMNTDTHEYLFWKTGKQPILEDEIAQLPNAYYDVVFAKSAGCIVFLEADRRNRIRYRKAVLFGAPLNLIDQFSIEPFLENQTRRENLLFVHQKHDRVCKPDMLEQAGINSAFIINGHDHKYENVHEYTDKVIQHIA